MAISAAQFHRLAGLHPKVRELAEALIASAAAAGITIIVTQGTRTNEQQAALYAQGRTTPGPNVTDKKPLGSIVTNAKPGSSYHNFQLAFDIAIDTNGDERGGLSWDTKVDVNENDESDYTEVGALGEKLGLQWGGRFYSIVDLPHFQYTFGLSLKDLRAGKRPPVTT